MKAFKEANDHYRGQRWREAADRYEAVIAAEPNTEAAPDFLAAYFFLGNSYDNLYKPAAPGRAGKRRLHDRRRSRTTRRRPNRSKNPYDASARAMEYLVAAYGPDKLNDPPQAEPIVQKMIADGPERADRLLRSCRKIYEDAGRYEEAEQALLKAREARAERSDGLELQLAGYYNRQGDFDKTMEAFNKAAELDPNNPQGYHLIGSLLPGEGSEGLPADARPRRPKYNAQGHRGRGQGARSSTRTTSRRWSTRTSCSGSRPTSKRIRRSRRS